MSFSAPPRPDAVLQAIAEKFESAAGHLGWVQDSPANYDFGRSGSGLDVARHAMACAVQSGRTLRILDAGCGSAGLLAILQEEAENDGVRLYLRGVTAERSETPRRLKPYVVLLPAAAADDRSGGAQVVGASADLAEGEGGADIRIYQRFPLEHLATATAADFVEEGRPFDLILCSWTLFHLCDPLGALLQMRALLDRQGTLLVNGVYFHFEGASCEGGGVDAMKLFLAQLGPEVECDIQGEPVRWIPDDPSDKSEWAAGDFRGGFQISLRWNGDGRPSEDVCAEVAGLFQYTGRVVDKVWHLASGSQYSVAAYSLQ